MPMRPARSITNSTETNSEFPSHPKAPPDQRRGLFSSPTSPLAFAQCGEDGDPVDGPGGNHHCHRESDGDCDRQHAD